MCQVNLVSNAIEGKFGQGKIKFRLGCIRGKLPEMSGSMIELFFLMMDLETIIRKVLYAYCGSGPYHDFTVHRRCFVYNMVG
jgi:hypothetical protein